MQPCSQPRYELIERSKPMSGERFQAMIVLGFSTVTVVLSGGGPSSTSSRASSQSPSASRTGRLKRVGVRFSGAPRPGRTSGRGMRERIARREEQIKNQPVIPAKAGTSSTARTGQADPESHSRGGPGFRRDDGV